MILPAMATIDIADVLIVVNSFIQSFVLLVITMIATDQLAESDNARQSVSKSQ